MSKIMKEKKWQDDNAEKKEMFDKWHKGRNDEKRKERRKQCLK